MAAVRIRAVTFGAEEAIAHQDVSGGHPCPVQVCDSSFFFFFSSRRRHTRLQGDWSSDVCSSDLCPAALAHIVMKCLEKRPADRWQSADELLAQLEPLATPSGGTTPTATRPMAAVIGTPLRRYVAAAVVLAAVVVGVVLLARPRPPAVALGRRVQVTLDPGLEIDPAISPDGRSFLYASGDSLYMRPLDGALARLIVTGLELHSFAWSPDGRWIAYVSGNKTFIADGTFGNLAPSSVWIVRATGGAPHRATDDRNLNMSPVWMPEGRALLYVSNPDGGRAVYAGTVAASGASAGPPGPPRTGA